MKMCQDHWDGLRVRLADRGLMALVAEDGKQAVGNLLREVKEGVNLDNYDPLMSAHWALVGNCDDFLRSFGQAPTMLVPPDDEHPEGWCPLCYLKAFVASARGEDGICTCGCGQPVPDPEGYEEWLDRAADDQVALFKSLAAGEPNFDDQAP